MLKLFKSFNLFRQVAPRLTFMDLLRNCHLFIYLFIYFSENATFNICKIHQYNQNLSSAIRHNSVLTTTPLKEENNNDNNNNKINYILYFKCSDKWYCMHCIWNIWMHLHCWSRWIMASCSKHLSLYMQRNGS